LEAFLRLDVPTLVSWGPLGVALLALIDSAGIPLPLGVDLLLIALAVAKPASAYWSASLATVGSVLGCLILFYLARKGGERFLYRHVKQGKARILTQWFQRYGLATVFVTALSPAPMPTKLFIICAGASGVRVAPFVLVVLAARSLRYFVLVYLGVQFGADAGAWVKAHAWYIAAATLGLFVVAAVVGKVAGRLWRRTKLAPSS
jgi:undecaprenyl-diphosphatase